MVFFVKKFTLSNSIPKTNNTFGNCFVVKDEYGINVDWLKGHKNIKKKN